jgi:arylsulfatase A-like enzyme
MDIAPTALDLFGLKVPSHMDGRSLIDIKNFSSGQNRKEEKK